ncbi:chitin binding [Pelomyxa schiedti]|nr:chitin binding [Pelomyxa schiedti]
MVLRSFLACDLRLSLGIDVQVRLYHREPLRLAVYRNEMCWYASSDNAALLTRDFRFELHIMNRSTHLPLVVKLDQASWQDQLRTLMALPSYDSATTYTPTGSDYQCSFHPPQKYDNNPTQMWIGRPSSTTTISMTPGVTIRLPDKYLGLFLAYALDQYGLNPSMLLSLAAKESFMPVIFKEQDNSYFIVNDPNAHYDCYASTKEGLCVDNNLDGPFQVETGGMSSDVSAFAYRFYTGSDSIPKSSRSPRYITDNEVMVLPGFRAFHDSYTLDMGRAVVLTALDFHFRHNVMMTMKKIGLYDALSRRTLRSARDSLEFAVSMYGYNRGIFDTQITTMLSGCGPTADPAVDCHLDGYGGHTVNIRDACRLLDSAPANELYDSYVLSSDVAFFIDKLASTYPYDSVQPFHGPIDWTAIRTDAQTAFNLLQAHRQAKNGDSNSGISFRYDWRALLAVIRMHLPPREFLVGPSVLNFEQFWGNTHNPELGPIQAPSAFPTSFCSLAGGETNLCGTSPVDDSCPSDPFKTTPGVCGCGVPDTDTDGDKTPDCHDGCPSDPNKVAPGVCGCGVSDSLAPSCTSDPASTTITCLSGALTCHSNILACLEDAYSKGHTTCSSAVPAANEGEELGDDQVLGVHDKKCVELGDGDAPNGKDGGTKAEQSGLGVVGEEPSIRGPDAERIIATAMWLVPVVLFTSPLLLIHSASLDKMWYELVCWGIEHAGPIWVKFGQWLSVRSDLLPPELCKSLSRLHSKCAEHPFEYTKKSIEQAFGEPIEKIFSSLSTSPVASGSIAQVHKGTLHAHPELAVAVKVLHPGVCEHLMTDLHVIRSVARAISSVHEGAGWISLVDMVDQFSRCMLAHANLHLEADNLNSFCNSFGSVSVIGKHGRYSLPRVRFSDVAFPRVIGNMVSKEVLVETFEDGVPLNDMLALGNTELNQRIAEVGASAFFDMVFRHQLLHMDLHPGNILFRPHPKRGTIFSKILSKFYLGQRKDIQLVFLDPGLTTPVTDEQVTNLRDLCQAVIFGDTELGARLMLERAPLKPNDIKNNQRNGEQFVHSMAGILQQARQLTSTNLGLLPVWTILGSAVETSRRHRVRLDTGLTNVILAAVVLEGLGKKLDPTMCLLPIVAEKAAQRLPAEPLRPEWS